MNRSTAIGAMLVVASTAVTASGTSPDWRAQLKSVGLRDKTNYSWRIAKPKGGSIGIAKPPKELRPGVKGETPGSLRRGPKTANGAAAKGSDPDLFVWSGSHYHIATSSEAEALRSQLRQRMAPIGSAWSLARASRLAEARSVLVPLLQDEDRREPAASILAEVALRQGHYSESLAILATYLSSIQNPDDCLTAAVAGAMTGNVFPGQIDFCKSIIYQKSGGDHVFAQFAVPSGSGPIVAKASALLAYASQANTDPVARHFFEQALTYVPHNAWANWSLGRLYLAARNYQAAENCFHIAAQYSTGDLQRIAKQDETDANYLRTNGG